MPTLQSPVISLPCYEPSGASLDWSIEDLLGHTLVLGGSGSGKTTRVVYPCIKQLINSPVEPAVVIYDSKADGSLTPFVTRACEQANRLDDLITISGIGDYHLDLFAPMRVSGMAGVATVAAILSSCIPRDQINRYWERTFEVLVRQSLRLLLVSTGDLTIDAYLKLAMDYLLHHKVKDPVWEELIDQLEEQQDSSCLGIDDQTRQEIISTHRMWCQLDYRTRSILQSMAASLISPLNEPVTRGFFKGGAAIDFREVLRARSIVVLIIDAVREPDAARLIGIVLKSQFYDAVLRRHASVTDYRPAGLILDDWALTATGGSGTRFSDVDALSMIRSRRGFVIAACQGLAGLDLAIGPASRLAAMANFANLLFFRSRDVTVDWLAATYLGERHQRLVETSSSQQGVEVVRHEREITTPAVPLGALARLPTGEAYALIGGQAYQSPLCLVPHYNLR